MNVFILTFEHRNGTNLSVHSSEALALKRAADIARTYWSEARTIDGTLPQFPPKDDMDTATLYFDAMQEAREFYGITESVLDVEDHGAEPAVREICEIIVDRGKLDRDEVFTLLGEIEDAHPDELYSEFIGPAVDGIENQLLARKEGNEGII